LYSCSILPGKNQVSIDRRNAPIGFGDSLGTGRSCSLQSLTQQLEQDLSPGQGDVGAFETNERSSTFGDLRGNGIINIHHKAKSASFEKNAAACGGKIGGHDYYIVFVIRIRDETKRP
jgi:hypothetical protein